MNVFEKMTQAEKEAALAHRIQDIVGNHIRSSAFKKQGRWDYSDLLVGGSLTERLAAAANALLAKGDWNTEEWTLDLLLPILIQNYESACETKLFGPEWRGSGRKLALLRKFQLEWRAIRALDDTEDETEAPVKFVGTTEELEALLKGGVS